MQATTLAERLERCLKDRPGLSKAGLARACKVRPPSVSNWFDGRTKRLTGGNLLSAASYLGVRPTWLANGEPPMREDESFDARISQVSETETPVGYVRFSLLDGFVAAGSGGYVPDYPEVVQYVEVAEDWAERNIRAPRSAVRVITARGDSMTGDISDGDVLFVDSRVQDFDTDSIYVMNWQGRPLVKRLQARRDGSVVIRSTNPAYEPEVVPPGEIDQLFISGRVLASWAFKKF